ncbi:MAG TPA: tRNA pseudouridine(55) synthase TruB [Firmicutes bacterium]|nr:tRNA pseudouridine(55) synthase TruB [Bacillota bacterium]
MLMKDGLLLIDKDSGETTRYIDNYISKKFGIKKVGHLGTLDPFATGLVIVGVGKGTKALTFLEESNKSYIARLALGKSTSTFDRDGEIMEEKRVPYYHIDTVKKAVESLTNITSQTPPMFSAIKINGTPLYKLARNGLEIERKEREVRIFESMLLAYCPPHIDFLVNVSKGTYIRSLGVELAKRLDNIGYLEQLRRISISSFSLLNAKKKEEISENDFISIKEALSSYPSLEIEGNNIKEVKNGKRMKIDKDDPSLLLYNKNEALAIYKKDEDGLYSCLRGLF